MKKLLYLIIVLLAAQSCRDDDCPEPDPCSEYPEKLEIQIKSYNWNHFTRSENEYVLTQDTVFYPQALIFQTNFEYDSIQWRIGNDPEIRYGSAAFIQFLREQRGSITIRAIGFRDVNTCYGDNDDGIDTLFKTIILKDFLTSPLLGTWRGTNNGEIDSFDFSLTPIFIEESGIQKFQYVEYSGIPKNTTTEKMERPSIIAEYLSFRGQDYSRDINYLSPRHFYGRVQENGTLRVEWRLVEGEQRVFTARKLN